MGLLAALLAQLSCNTTSPPPGDEQLGSFALHADPTARACDLSDMPDGGFDFVAVSTDWKPDGGTHFGNTAYVTLSGIPQPGTYDADSGTLTATYVAPRTFADCGGCNTRISETMTVVLLSASQTLALNGGCPAPNTSAPIDPDAGIMGPGPTDGAYDAVRACGTLHDAVVATLDPALDGGCIAACFSCTFDYALSGDRK